MNVLIEQARERAARFIDFCDGAEEAGLVAYARRGRCVARDCLEALTEIETLRSLIQAQNERIARLEKLAEQERTRAMARA